MSEPTYGPGDRVEVFDGDRRRWCPGTVQQWWTEQDLSETRLSGRVLVVKSDNEFEGELPLTWGVPEDALELVRKIEPRVTRQCGGCEGLGAHQRYCPQHPDYHPWRELADRAEDIGDRIGGSDTGLANQAYALAGAIKRAMPEHPWRRPPG